MDVNAIFIIGCTALAVDGQHVGEVRVLDRDRTAVELGPHGKAGQLRVPNRQVRVPAIRHRLADAVREYRILNG
jgi:hypothetical protein